MDTVRLRELRAGKRVPLKDLAQVIGKSKHSYVKKENGAVNFLPDEIIALANFYGLSYGEVNAIFFDGNLPVGKNENLKTVLGGTSAV